MDLGAPARFLKGVGPTRAERLARLGILTLQDLVEHYPRAYLDRTLLTPIGRLQPGQTATSIGTIRQASLRRTRGPMRNLHVLLGDDTGFVECVWFNQPRLRHVLLPGRRMIVSGPVEMFGRLQFKNPEFELLASEEPPGAACPAAEERATAPGIVPVYPLTAGIAQHVMRRLADAALDEAAAGLEEFMPPELLGRLGLPDWRQAHSDIHRPPSQSALAAARHRIAFQELFDLQTLLAISRKVHQRPATARPLVTDGRLIEQWLATLPFAPTRAQIRVIGQICADLARDCPMHRLLEGDVGSGKTLVALTAALHATAAGAQTAFMAPTEILAQQHARNFERLCGPLGVRVGSLSGGLPAARAQEVRAALAAGELDIAVGTHALIQESVAFAALGLVVVDEQHRFGVLQRARLLGKGRTPHALIMSATPIPRTLALTLFGDLDLSVLDEKPPGRRPPKTHLVSESRYEEMLGYVARELADGAQAYFVCPVIAASETTDLAAATELYDRLAKGSALRGFPGALLHGRLRSEEKDRVMRAFAAGEVRYLVATTVIEVGVDVAAASLMVIEHPERFGLSQLHQLRGRVGRGRQPAHLFLIQRGGVGEDAARRLEVLVRESDGFRIAEEDLRQRGPGDFFGVQQSGLPALKVADPVSDPGLLEKARAEAFAWVESLTVAELMGTPLGHRLSSRFGDRMSLYGVG
jgi:ATP-dependent DNA helicase RecG